MTIDYGFKTMKWTISFVFWMLFIHSVLIFNFALLDSQCVLVKGWKGSSWSFPRGKKNKDEEDHACAIREVRLILLHFFYPARLQSSFII